MIRKTTRVYDFTDETDENPFLVGFKGQAVMAHHTHGLNLIMTTKQALAFARELSSVVEKWGG